MAKKGTTTARSVSPSAVPPSSTTAYKTQSSASSSQSGTTSTSKSTGTTAVPSSSSTPSKSSSAASKTPSKSQKQPQSFQDIIITIRDRYVQETPQRVKIIDAFLAFLVLLGAVQFLYVIIVGNYPFNAFLSGFSACVGQFVLTCSLRIQTNPENKKGNFDRISDERAFADFVLGSLILHLFCVNFIN